VKRRRSSFPWVTLIVGLTVGVASLGLLVILVISLWPSEKGGKGEIANQPVAAPDDFQKWQEFVSPEGRFRVLMPGTPKFENSVVHTRLGSLPVKAYDVESGDWKFSVFYGDLDSAGLQEVSPEEWIDAVRDIYKVRSQANLLIERGLWLHGHKGKETRFELSVGWIVGRRMYSVNRRIYTVNVSRKKHESLEAVIAHFFDSFQILDEGKAEEH